MSPKVESEVKLWLATALKTQNFSNFSVKIVENSDKSGEIIFVHLSTPHQDYNLALKKHQSLKHETFLYETLLPTFINFQKEKNLGEIFNSVPKFYGSYKNETVHVIVLEDLKKLGYEMWPLKKPLNRQHIEFVICEYGKLHATSVALKIFKPEKFQALVTTLKENFTPMTRIVQNSGELLRGEVDETTRRKFTNLAEKIPEITSEERFQVVCHGNCNFMYKYYGERRNVPEKVAFIDWQNATFATPVSDLSYFLFSCISEEDFQHLDDILNVYRLAFSNHLKDFGLDAEKLYPLERFSADWKTCAKYGLVKATMVYGEKAEIFLSEIRDKKGYRNRIGYLVKNAAKYGLLA